MQKTSFSCEITSIERRTIFDLWQMSYTARSSLRSLRYASQKTCSGWLKLEKGEQNGRCWKQTSSCNYNWHFKR